MTTGKPCPFCAIAEGHAPAHRVLESDTSVAFLDLRPVFHGHVLVIPRAHHETLPDLPPDLGAPFFLDLQKVARAVEMALAADGTFVAMNNRVSQSVPHLHAHVVPRRRKDGLKGFFWPRQAYADSGEMDAIAAKLRAAIG